jgi:hypothetical protein
VPRAVAPDAIDIVDRRAMLTAARAVVAAGA